MMEWWTYWTHAAALVTSGMMLWSLVREREEGTHEQ